MVSCGKDSGTRDIYQIVLLNKDVSYGSIRVPGKFNVLTGSVTPLCEDPVCTHEWDNGCAFESFQTTSPYTLHNGKFYYTTKDFRDFYSDYFVWCFDLLDGRRGLVCEIPFMTGTVSVRTLISGGHMYYTYLESGEQYDIDLSTGRAVHRDETTENERSLFVCEYKGKKYYLDCEKTALTAVDKAGTRNEVIRRMFANVFFDEKGGRIVYSVKDGGVYAFDLSDGSERVIADGVMSSFVLYGDSICYTKPVDDPPYLGYDRNDHEDKYNMTGGIIWRTDLRTGETDKLFDDASYNLEYWTFERIGGHLVMNYTNTDYSTYTEEEGNSRFGAVYVYPSETGKVVVNTENKECNIYEVSYN